MIDFDFLPPDFHARRAEQRGARRYALLIGAMLAAMAIWVAANQAMLRRTRQDLADVQRQKNQLRIHRALLEQLMSERRELRSRDQLCGILEDSASFGVVLAELSRVVPPSVALAELIWHRDGPTPGEQPAEVPLPTSRPAAGTALPSLRLVGLAPDAARISDCAAGIAGSRLLTDVSTRTLPNRQIGGRECRAFEIACQVLPQTGGDK